MINWDEAPEGTTHGCEVGAPGYVYFGQWRRVTDKQVFFYKNKGWIERPVSTPKGYLEVNPHIVERPEPIIVEAELPDGKVWPADMTYYSHKVGGLFFNEKMYIYNGGVPIPWMVGLFEAWSEFGDTIKRFPGAKPKAPVEAPVKKKPVGWWN